MDGLGTTEQSYYNSCACNEHMGLTDRHLLPNCNSYVSGNPEMQSLRKEVLAFSQQFEPVEQAEVSEVLKYTKTTLRARYRNAHAAKVGRRIAFDQKYSRVKAFVKFEPGNVDKIEAKPPRLIQFRSYEYLYELKSHLMGFGLMVKADPERYIFPTSQPLYEVFTKYTPEHVHVQNMRNRWDEFPQPIAVCKDHSKFDGRYHVDLLKIEHEFWNAVFRSPALKRLLDLQLNNKGRTNNGLKYKVLGKRMSGEWSTSDGNSLMNAFMLYRYFKSCGVKTFYIFVNGDDSVTIMDRSEQLKLKTNKWFEQFNMVTEDEIITQHFQHIKFCQKQPLFLGNSWRFVKDPRRTMSRMVYCSYKFKNCVDRYMAGKALCELAVSKGIPIIQAFCLKILSDNMVRPLGSVDKVPAKTAGDGISEIIAISPDDRREFEFAFDITVQEQIYLEQSIAGDLSNDPKIRQYLQKYKFFTNN